MSSRSPESWEKIKLCVFDLPASKSAFEERLIEIQNVVKKINNPRVVPVQFTKCQSLEHMQSILKEIEKDHGEGLMIRRPGSLYEAGRSENILKVKTFSDMEARYLGPNPKPGYHSYTCETPWGKSFNVNCTMSDWKYPPPVGSVITVRYSGMWKSGLPKYPFYYRPRNDLTWEDVVAEYEEKKKEMTVDEDFS